MPAPISRPTNSFQAVAAGQTAVLELPVGSYFYQQCQIVYGTSTAGGPNQTNMEAELTEIRVKVNGKVQRVFSAAELFAMQAVDGLAFEAGYLPIYFAEPWRRTPTGEEIFGWGTGDIDSLHIEIDIDAGATGPTLRANTIHDRLRRPLGHIKKVRRQSIGVTATGIRNVVNLDKRDAYLRMHAVSTDIDDIEITVDGETPWDMTVADMAKLYADHGISLPASLTSVLFDYRQRYTDFLQMEVPDGRGGARFVQEFRVDFNMNAANTFTLLAETFGPRD